MSIDDLSTSATVMDLYDNEPPFLFYHLDVKQRKLLKKSTTFKDQIRYFYEPYSEPKSSPYAHIQRDVRVILFVF